MSPGRLQLRREALVLLAAGLVAPAFGIGRARPLRVIVPQAAGGAADSLVRLLGDELAKILQRPVLIENHPGGGTVAGTVALVNAPPDGNTIGLVLSALAINQALRRRLPYDALTDLAPVCLCGYSVLALVAVSELPANDMGELLALAARSRPPLQYGSLGVGSASHVAGELLNAQAGIETEHVPFNGSGQIYQALLGGQLPLAYVTLESALPYVRRGRLKVLGVTNASRSAPFAAFAPIAETVPGYEVIGFLGFMAPAHIPPAAVAALYDAIQAVLVSPAWTSRANELAMVVNVGSPPAFASFLRQEITRYRTLTLQAGIKLE